jgi:beta-lactam-binding protein with PASTA domain
MPNFVGQPLGTVSQTLQSAGIHIANVSVASGEALPAWAVQTSSPDVAPSAPGSASPFSLILAQSPAAGQKITVGSTVTFEVSR